MTTATSLQPGTLLQQREIEQNRCAMACQGCGAAFYFF